MELGHIEVFVADLDQARLFYCDVLGFELVTIQNKKHIWLKKGQQEFLLRPGRPHIPASRYEDAPMGIVLYTSDLENTRKDLEAKGVQIKGTIDSSKCYTFTDPDGNWFQLVNPNDH